jgi:hypothetical protein
MSGNHHYKIQGFQVELMATKLLTMRKIATCMD